MLPLAHVGVSMQALPNSVAMLEAIVPLSIIYFSIGPGIDTLPVSLAHAELPIVRVCVWISFEASTTPQVLLPVTLVLSPVFVAHHTLSITFALNELTHEDCIRILALEVTWESF